MGSWSFLSYDKQIGEIKITGGIPNLHSAGCLDAKNVASKGTNIFSKEDCLDLGLRWFDESQENGNCVLIEGWFDDKTYYSNVKCSHSKNGYIHDYTPAFNGYTINYADLKSGLDDYVSCTGEIVIKKEISIEVNNYYRLSNNLCTLISINPLEKTTNDYLTLNECEGNIILIVDNQSCSPNWVTGSWSNCVNKIQTRTVTDSKNCGITYGKPAISQSCNEIIHTCSDGIKNQDEIGIDCGGPCKICETKKCYSFIEFCQEVPCSSSYTIYD